MTMHVVVAGAVELAASTLSSPESYSELLELQSRAPASAFSPPPGTSTNRPSPRIRTRVASAGETFGELVVLGIHNEYGATARALEPTALYMIEQAQLHGSRVVLCECCVV